MASDSRHNTEWDEWNQLCARWSQCGYESLNDTERLWLNVRALIDSVNNGGLISYFYNTYAERYADCVEALKHLEASDVLGQVQRLATLFGDAVPTSIEARNEIINSWPDYGREHDICEETDEAVSPLMESLDQSFSPTFWIMVMGHNVRGQHLHPSYQCYSWLLDEV